MLVALALALTLGVWGGVQAWASAVHPLVAQGQVATGHQGGDG